MMDSEPDPIVPAPASQFAQIRGRRVIIGIPGVGFRGDLRGDNTVVQGGRTYVPVLTEQDYYRAEIEQIEVFAPLVPIDRVWVEAVSPAGTSSAATLDSPGIRRPIRAAERRHDLSGRRLIHSVADGYVRDLRALTDSFANTAGTECIRACSESDWYAWALTGAPPQVMELPIRGLWIE